MEPESIKRICKRHMARLLNKIKNTEHGLQDEHVKVIMKEFSYLMDDLAKISKNEENQSDATRT